MAVASPAIKRAVNAFKSNDLIITGPLEKHLREGRADVFDEHIAEYVKMALMGDQRVRTGAFTPSQLGQCQRRQLFRFLGFPEMASADTRANLVMTGGSWHHIKWQATLLQIGVLSEVEVYKEDPVRRFTGMLDGIGKDSEGHFGFELKTVNRFTFKQVVDDGPKDEHMRQVVGYSYLTGLDRFSLTYEDRDTMDYKEFVVKVKESDINDVERVLDGNNVYLQTQKLPPQLNGCRKKQGDTYKDCPYRSVCEDAQWPSQTPPFPVSPSVVGVKIAPRDTSKPPKTSRPPKSGGGKQPVKRKGRVRVVRRSEPSQ